MENHQHEAQIEEAQKELRKLFQNIPNEIPVFLFAAPGKNDVFADAARQALRFFRQLTDKIKLREYNMDHELARKWKIQHSPTLVLAPDTFNGWEHRWGRKDAYSSRH